MGLTTDFMLERSRRLLDEWAAFHARMDAVRGLSRQRNVVRVRIRGKEIPIPQTSRAMAIVSQARAYADNAEMAFAVRARGQGANEDRTTSRLEQWCRGVDASLRPWCGRPYRDARWHYFESGVAVLRTLLNLDRALCGEFALDVQAIDPRTFAARWVEGRMVQAVIQEKGAPADSVLASLERLAARAAHPRLSIPAALAERAADPRATVAILRVYDEEKEYLYIDDAPVWDKPHSMGRVPFDVGFCLDMPAEPVHPEEYGWGMIAPILGMLAAEQEMIGKTVIPIEMFYYPLVGIQEPGRFSVEQAYPGLTIDTNGGEVQVTPFRAQPDPQVIANLMQFVSGDIARTALPEAAFGPPSFQQSGFAWSQVMGGMSTKIGDYTRGLEDLFSRHFGHLLDRLEKLASAEYAASLGLDDTARENFLNGFGVYETRPTSRRAKDAGEASHGRLVLAGDEVDGHTVVDVTLAPRLPQDENAKFQRGQLAHQIGLPLEYIVRQVLQVEQPDRVLDAIREEQLLQADPEWSAFNRWRMRAALLTDAGTRVEYEAFTRAGRGTANLEPAESGAARSSRTKPNSIPGVGLPGNAPEEIFGE